MSLCTVIEMSNICITRLLIIPPYPAVPPYQLNGLLRPAASCSVIRVYGRILLHYLINTVNEVPRAFKLIPPCKESRIVLNAFQEQPFIGFRRIYANSAALAVIH